MNYEPEEFPAMFLPEDIGQIVGDHEKFALKNQHASRVFSRLVRMLEMDL
jgi:hypothetical protein